ncbi:MAG: hypothetical protein ACJ76I_07185 [Gaiellaceae bacterium]
MRKMTFVAVALAALIATSYAVAHGIEGAKSAKAVAATFSATASSTSTRTCTTTDNKTIVVTDGKYTGTSTGATAADADLTGPLTLRARSVVNTTDNVGTVGGSFRIDVAAGKDTRGAYAAVYDHGNIAGLASGKAHGPNAKLLANLSAGFAAATGFTGGKLGGGTAAGSAVELGPGSCRPSSPAKETSEAHGAITALSATSITVASVTCTIPTDKSADVNAKFKQGDVVRIKCGFANGASTLTSISKNH